MNTIMPLLTLIFTLLLFGCGKDTNAANEIVLARVDNTVLTNVDMEEQIGSAASSEQQRAFIRRWMDRELLYQAAKSADLHKDSEFRNKMIESEKNLLSMIFLNSLVKGTPEEVTEQDVHEYFKNNRKQYTRSEDVIRYVTFVVGSRSDAWNMRTGMSASNFMSRAKRNSKAAVPSQNEIEFTPRSQVPSQIRESLFSIKEGGITVPVKDGDNWNLYYILEKGKKGEEATLGEVYSDVKNYLVKARYETMVNDAMSELRATANCTFNNEYFETTTDSQVSMRGNGNE